MSNRLATETSPYLLQHAQNPVDWFPWGEEALSRATREDKPILLSIGYSACHWCHVMERECFSNPAIATLLNDHFICIKVDREERPDLDAVYMAATLAISGAGGWPMTVFLTPEQTPFFAGTYFPPFDTEGRPGFATLINRVTSMWKADRGELFREASEIAHHIQKQAELPTAANLPAAAAELAVTQLEATFDDRHGGFSPAPKFPPCESLHLLLSHYNRTGSEKSLHMVKTTLDAMKNGGIYDQLAGGFARYSTDNEWHVPHFEKMLYDNAQLARVYLAAFTVTQDQEYERIGRETLNFIRSRLQADAGGFYCALDADCEGQEGKHYTFGKLELAEVLNDTELRLFCEYYDVSADGNWEGTNVLWRPRSVEQVTSKLKVVNVDAFEEAIERLRSKVLAYRDTKPPPARDEKILTSWNGLAISAMTDGYRALGDASFLASAIAAAELLWQTHRDAKGVLVRALRKDQRAVAGFLDDYAFLADSLISLYECSGQVRFLDWATELATQLQQRFLDPDSGAFFQTANDAKIVVARPRDGNDGALPNANATAAKVLARLGLHLSNPDLTSVGRGALRAYAQRIDRRPRAFTSALNALEWLLTPPVEIVLTDDEKLGVPSHETPLFRALGRRYLPVAVVAHAGLSREDERRDWVTSKANAEGPRAFICHEGVCRAPSDSVQALQTALEETQTQLYNKRRPTLAGPRLAGRASAEGTARYFATRRLSNAWNSLGATRLQVSKLGFGGYRIADNSESHEHALRLAFDGGVNLVDTAPSYSNGGSELLVGRVLAELVRQKKLARDEIIICSKFGILPNEDVAAGHFGPLGMHDSATGEEADKNATYYSLNAAHLDVQLETSLRRLGLESLDICLLHNPEILLSQLLREKDSPQLAVTQFEQELSQAYAWCERQVAAGRIGLYGVSTSMLGQPPPRDRVQAEDDAAHAQLRQLLSLDALLPSKSASGACVLQLPINPLNYCGGRPLLAEAQRRGLIVLGHRPLTAVVHGKPLRLSEPSVDPAAPTFQTALTALQDLEQEFRTKLGAVLRAVPESGIATQTLFCWSDKIARFDGGLFEIWTEFERNVLGRELPPLLQALDGAFQGKHLGPHWTAWKERYVSTLETLVLATRARSALASRERTKELASVLRQHCPIGRSRARLSQIVLWSLSSIENATAVLTGMHTPEYAQQAVSVLNWPDHVDAGEALDACAALNR